MQFKLKIEYRSWQKEKNQGLCDLKEIKDPKSQAIIHNFEVKKTGVIFRNKNDYSILFQPFNKVKLQQKVDLYEPLLLVQKMDSKFKILNLKDSKQPLALIVPYGQQYFDKRMTIKKGCKIKLGKIEVEVLCVYPQVKKSEDLYKMHQKSLIDKFNCISTSDYLIIDERSEFSQILNNEYQNVDYSLCQTNPQCRYCLGKTISNDNRLICLCKCKGSSKYIHEECLKKWIQQKSSFTRKENSDGVYFATFQGFICQVCKQKYSAQEMHKLIFEKNASKMNECVILSVTREEGVLMYVIDLEKEPLITIGRDQMNTICINEPTLSRKHCKIYKKNKKQQKNESNIQSQFIIQDNDSKFGTSIMRSNIILQEQSIELIKGRTYFRMKKNNKQKKNFLSKFAFCAVQF